MRSNSRLIALLFLLSFICWVGTRIYNELSFDRNVEGYLKRAADSNTVQLAQENLGIALKQIEVWRMTRGYTSLVYTTPDEDVGFWYQNLKASYKELGAVHPDATQLEKANILMKLRETLLDGSKVTAPQGIAVFPYNLGFFLWAVISALLAIAFFVWDRRSD